MESIAHRAIFVNDSRRAVPGKQSNGLNTSSLREKNGGIEKGLKKKP
jgi:hypothetical protein